MITVALDSGGVEAARTWIERAHPKHPALIDQRHVVAELYGINNVAMAVWIDEDGMIVRPPETPATNERMAEMLGIGPTEYLDALRDWAAKGAASVYLPTEEQRRRRLHLPSPEAALAAVNFRLAEHLLAASDRDAARPYYEEARRLQPEDWRYRRQYWVIYEPEKNMGRGWYDAMLQTGDRPYYEPVQLGDRPEQDRAEVARRQREIYVRLFKPMMAPDS